MDYEPRVRISRMKMVAMIFVATFFWLFGLIPYADWISTPLGWYTFWIWFAGCEASLAKNKGKNIASGAINLIFSIFGIPDIGPLLSAFPVVIFFNIRTVQKEDVEYNKKMQAETEEKFDKQRMQYQMRRASQANIPPAQEGNAPFKGRRADQPQYEGVE